MHFSMHDEAVHSHAAKADVLADWPRSLQDMLIENVEQKLALRKRRLAPHSLGSSRIGDGICHLLQTIKVRR
jgi:hypothetical protein